MNAMKLTVSPALPSLSRVRASTRPPLRVGLVQTSWHSDESEHLAALNAGIEMAAGAGAKIVFLQELTLSRYPADTLPSGTPNQTAEPLETGPTYRFAAAAAAKHGVHVHASLYEHQPLADGRGYNTAIIVAPDGAIIARTRKLHIPVTAGYYEDQYFCPGPAEPDPYPVWALGFGATSGDATSGGEPPNTAKNAPAQAQPHTAHIGLPTCWDEWFSEVTRAYSLAGAEVLAYPTAIGSEPDHPEFDTEPLWRQVIVGNAIANGTFMVVPNRWGNEGKIEFYGSSFIADPFGRILARAGRTGDEVLVADLDLDQRRDWLDLFPFLATRRPDTYERLLRPVVNPRGESGEGVHGGIAGIAQAAQTAQATQTAQTGGAA